MKKNLFELKHFTCPVQYTLDYFIAKNKDTLSNDILIAMKTSKDPIVLSLFQDLVGDDDTTKGRKVSTIHFIDARFCFVYLYLFFLYFGIFVTIYVVDCDYVNSLDDCEPQVQNRFE
jgi:hypothetical protein